MFCSLLYCCKIEILQITNQPYKAFSGECDGFPFSLAKHQIEAGNKCYRIINTFDLNTFVARLWFPISNQLFYCQRQEACKKKRPICS
jgi:hypothetical protein